MEFCMEETHSTTNSRGVYTVDKFGRFSSWNTIVKLVSPERFLTNRILQILKTIAILLHTFSWVAYTLTVMTVINNRTSHIINTSLGNIPFDYAGLFWRFQRFVEDF